MHVLEKIKHLYRRAGFGWSPEEWDQIKDRSLSETLDQLFKEAVQPASLESSLTEGQGKEARKKNLELAFEQNLNWLHRMSSPEGSPLLERMSLFWHDHFACRTRNGFLAASQLNAIRTHALGNFRSLLKAMARDVSMIRFLNNQQNRKKSPNENFARELMELFTLGRGHYTETDIKEAARAFTGWSSNLRGEFVFRPYQHDSGQKQFMGKQGNFDGDDIIDIILDNPQTARYLAEKIYRYFVNEEIREEEVRALATVFYVSGYDIGHLLRSLFESEWFYDARNIGNKIKSPIDLMAGMLRGLNASVDDRLSLLYVQRALGQVLFDPPNVAGWAGGRNWIDNSTLMLRLSLPTLLFQAAEVDLRIKDRPESGRKGGRLKNLKATIDLQTLYRQTERMTEVEIRQYLMEMYLPANALPETSLLDRFSVKGGHREYVNSLCLRIMSTPEYQLS